MVRYNTPLEESATFATIRRAIAGDDTIRDTVQVLLWDNSPTPLIQPSLPPGFEYRSSPANLGVAGAYNEASRIAHDLGADWLLLLDQDTSLPPDFLRIMLAASNSFATNPQVAAIVPTVKVGDLIVSPRSSTFNGHADYAEADGISKGEPFAINSGCLLRLSALEAIGGFSPDFWLDYSDRYVFHQFFLRGFRIARANVELQHEMTILDYDRLMSPWRYRNFIEAEGAFNDLYKSTLENAVQTLRLVVRVVRQRLRYRNPQFSQITLSHLWTRLTSSRKRRIANWRSAQLLRQTAR
jgi:hypothetical protein